MKSSRASSRTAEKARGCRQAGSGKANRLANRLASRQGAKGYTRWPVILATQQNVIIVVHRVTIQEPQCLGSPWCRNRTAAKPQSRERASEVLKGVI